MTPVTTQPIAAASYVPFFGATPNHDGTTFRVWAPMSKAVSLVMESGDLRDHPMRASGNGIFTVSLPDAATALYRYRLGDGALRPDPASRYQPDVSMARR